MPDSQRKDIDKYLEPVDRLRRLSRCEPIRCLLALDFNLIPFSMASLCLFVRPQWKGW